MTGRNGQRKSPSFQCDDVHSIPGGNFSIDTPLRGALRRFLPLTRPFIARLSLLPVAAGL